MKIAAIAVGLIMLPLAAESAGIVPKVKQREYVGDVYDYATCTVRNYHNRARDLILADLDNAAMERKFSDIYTSKPIAFIPGCRELFLRPRQGIAIDPDLFRASLATVLVRKDFGAATFTVFDGVAPLSHRVVESDAQFRTRLDAVHSDQPRARMKLERDKDLTRVWLSQFGECAARRNPLASKEWLLAAPGSQDDAAAVSKLTPDFGACLAAGETLAFPKDVLRGTLAINYYRLAMAESAVSMGAIK